MASRKMTQSQRVAYNARRREIARMKREEMFHTIAEIFALMGMVFTREEFARGIARFNREQRERALEKKAREGKFENVEQAREAVRWRVRQKAAMRRARLRQQGGEQHIPLEDFEF